ncbi:uncharacterized protein LOC135126043 [Zophobas morio]
MVDPHAVSEWTCDEVLQLITEYGKRPALWDPDCKDYKNRFIKHQMWLELSEIFKYSKLEVERKMKILNSQFRRERLKALRMRRMGKTHKITWYGYSAFSFMNKNLARYKNKSKGLMIRSVVKQEEDVDNFVPLLKKFKQRLDQDGNSVENQNVDSGLVENADGTVDGDKEPQQFTDGVFRSLHETKDEWALFGELVAHTLRKLPDMSRCIAKHKINTVLYEAELITYNSSDKTVK